MLRFAALLLTALTGFCGLVYEVAWQRILAILLGSHSEATAVVLGLFLGGLALGYALFGSFTRRRVAATRAVGRAPRLLAAYAAVETALGLYALLFPTLFGGARALSVAYVGGGLTGFALDALLSAALIGPPSILMGATIPMLTQALARDREEATRVHALVYGCNTAGATAGALAAGFWLIPALGLTGVLAAAGCANLFAGGAFALLDWRAARTAAAHSAAEPHSEAAPTRRTDRDLVAIALLCGTAMMAIQTVLNRLGALAFGASQFSFSMVVAVFVLGIAFGSFAVSALRRIHPNLWVWNLWALWLLLYALYSPLQDAPYWAHVLRSRFGADPSDFYPYHLSAALGTLLVIGLPVAISGATLPLLFHKLRGGSADLGGTAGRLYAWNTLGALLGALLGGYALLYWVDLHHVYRLALASIALAAALATRRSRRSWRAVPALLFVAVLVAIALLDPWAPERLASGAFRMRRAGEQTYAGADAFFNHYQQGSVVFYDDDPSASIAVKQQALDAGRFDRSIVTNGKSDSSVIGERITSGLLGLIPALLAEHAQRAFVVGYGTGVTVSELAALESMNEVLVAEISPAVLDAAPLFDYANGAASLNPKIRILRSDAHRSLLREEGPFDVIASAPSNAWVAGVETLYTREFLEASHARLAPGGVHAQWFQSYEADADLLELMLRTYAAVFDDFAVWYTSGVDLLLLGFRDPSGVFDLERLARRIGRADYAAGLARSQIRSLPALLAHELLPLGVVHAARLSGPLHTALEPRLGHLATRSFFSGRLARLPRTVALAPAAAGGRNSLVRRYRALRGSALSEVERRELVAETCAHRATECLTLLAQWKSEVPDSRERAQILVALSAHPEVYGQTRLELLEPVSRLFEPGGTLPAEPEAIGEWVDRFVEFYHHAAPFPRATLDRAWQRCARDPARSAACRAGRERSERILGDLAD